MVVVDSDILIRYLRGIPAAVQAVQNLAASDSLACSVVTTFEVLRGATPAQLPATEALLASLDHLEVTEEIAREAAYEWRALRARNVTLSLPDTLIGVSARTHQAPLLTGNPRHFPLKGLKVVSP